MLLHRVSHSVGTAERNGAKFYGYRAICGAPIVAAVPLTDKSVVTVGPEPHAQCSKCFASDEAHNDVSLPDDPLSAPVYDENGKRLEAFREREPTEIPRPRRPQQIQDDNGLGNYEHRPYG